MKPANAVLSGYGTSVFEVMTLLAAEHDAINLGQGSPDEDGPADVLRAAAEALTAHSNQYPPAMGLPRLCRAVAAHDRRFYGIEADPDAEVLITTGGTEALAATLLGLIEPGDEVVLIEPLYDSYLPMVRRAGATPRLVRLAPPDWTLTEDALAAAFSERTKLVVLNSPMNPTGKVFTDDELRTVAELTARFDAYAVCDEVYEHMVFDGRRHVPLMTLPGMRERTVRIGSAGKIFPLTGWKVGFAVAAPEVLAPIATTHQVLTFTVPPNLQHGIAHGLERHADALARTASDMAARRDRLAAGLAGIGLEVLPCRGTYFLVADIAPVGFAGDDDAFCRHITTEAGVSAVPVSPFYAGPGAPDHFVRFSFGKSAAVLDEAVARLERHFGGRGGRR